nr:MAG TPA: hypothetical protein [Caudoviricetes sp.]
MFNLLRHWNWLLLSSHLLHFLYLFYTLYLHFIYLLNGLL